MIVNDRNDDHRADSLFSWMNYTGYQMESDGEPFWGRPVKPIFLDWDDCSDNSYVSPHEITAKWFSIVLPTWSCSMCSALVHTIFKYLVLGWTRITRTYLKLLLLPLPSPPPLYSPLVLLKIHSSQGSILYEVDRRMRLWVLCLCVCAYVANATRCQTLTIGENIREEQGSKII